MLDYKAHYETLIVNEVMRERKRGWSQRAYSPSYKVVSLSLKYFFNRQKRINHFINKL